VLLSEAPGRLSGDMCKCMLEKIIGGCQAKQKYLERGKTFYMCKFYVVPLHKGECFQ
jgi:hypothetical protein